MSHRRGSFHDWSEQLEWFAHRGTPAALEDQLREAKQLESEQGERAFHLNESLFERS